MAGDTIHLRIKVTLELKLHLLRNYKKVESILAWVNPDLKSDLLLLSNTEIENNLILSPATAKTK